MTKSELDQVYRKYKGLTNMRCAVLKKWKKNPCSKTASIGRAAINRNIMLQCTPKNKWTSKHIKEAKKAISYLSRTKNQKIGKSRKKGCPAGSVVARKNWARDVTK